MNCIYVINLDWKKERWERIKAISTENKIYVNRFSAIDGWQLSRAERKELTGPYPIRINPGEFGCLLSHLSILKHASEKEYNTILVLEDDIEIPKELDEISFLLDKLHAIDPDWDIFYLDTDPTHPDGVFTNTCMYYLDPRPGQKLQDNNYYRKKVNVDDCFTRIRRRYCTYSMLISKKGIEKILNYFSHLYVWSALDIDIHYIPGIHQYNSTKEIITTDRSTDTDTTVTTYKRFCSSFIENPFFFLVLLERTLKIACTVVTDFFTPNPSNDS